MDEERTSQPAKGPAASSAQGADQTEETSGPQSSTRSACGPDWVFGNSCASGSDRPSEKSSNAARPSPSEFASSLRSMMAEMCGETSLPDCCPSFFGMPVTPRAGEAATTADSDREGGE